MSVRRRRQLLLGSVVAFALAAGVTDDPWMKLACSLSGLGTLVALFMEQD